MGMSVRFSGFPLQLQASAKNSLPSVYHLDFYESHNPNSNISNCSNVLGPIMYKKVAVSKAIPNSNK